MDLSNKARLVFSPVTGLEKKLAKEKLTTRSKPGVFQQRCRIASVGSWSLSGSVGSGHLDLILCSSAASATNKNVLHCEDFAILLLNRKLPFYDSELRAAIWADVAVRAPPAAAAFAGDPAALGVFRGLHKHPS